MMLIIAMESTSMLNAKLKIQNNQFQITLFIIAVDYKIILSLHECHF